MGDETQEAPAPKKRGRPPKSPEQREKHAKRAAVRRLLQKLESAADADELMSRLDELRGEAPAAAAAPKDAGSPVREVNGEVLEEGQRPGWPPPSRIAEYLPVARGLWSALGSELEGTEFSLAPQRHVLVDPQGNKQVVTIDPVDRLAEATAPVLAAHVPSVVTTPEAGLALAVASVFLPPLARWAGRLLSGLFSRSPVEASTSAEPSTTPEEARAAA